MKKIFMVALLFFVTNRSNNTFHHSLKLGTGDDQREKYGSQLSQMSKLLYL